MFENTDEIFRYTRAQAIADGILVDLAVFRCGGLPIAEQMGFRYPLAITAAAFGEVVGSPSSPALFRRLIYVLGNLKRAIEANGEGDRVYFTVKNTELYPANLWALVGPGDTLDPVITVMLEGED